MMHVLVSDGTPNRYNMDLLHVSDADLEKLLADHNGDPCGIFLLCMDDDGNTFCIDKQKEKENT